MESSSCGYRKRRQASPVGEAGEQSRVSVMKIIASQLIAERSHNAAEFPF